MAQAIRAAPPPELVLCYVSGCWAFFTDRPLEEQWGDDWNEDGTPKWKIVKVAWEGPFETPREMSRGPNSPYSVRDINRGAIAWLTPASHVHHTDVRPIPAGLPLEDFKRIIKAAGGRIYSEEAP